MYLGNKWGYHQSTLKVYICYWPTSNNKHSYLSLEINSHIIYMGPDFRVQHMKQSILT